MRFSWRVLTVTGGGCDVVFNTWYTWWQRSCGWC